MSPTNFLADVRGLVCEAFCKPNFDVNLGNVATDEVITKGHHQPFLNPASSVYHVLFQWVPLYEPGEHLALTDGTVDGEWPTVSSDSAAAGGYQTPYTTNMISCGSLALSWEEALGVCRLLFWRTTRVENGRVHVVQHLREHIDLRPGQDDREAVGVGRRTGIANNCQPLALTLAPPQIGSCEAQVQQEM